MKPAPNPLSQALTRELDRLTRMVERAEQTAVRRPKPQNRAPLCKAVDYREKTA